MLLVPIEFLSAFGKSHLVLCQSKIPRPPIGIAAPLYSCLKFAKYIQLDAISRFVKCNKVIYQSTSVIECLTQVFLRIFFTFIVSNQPKMLNFFITVKAVISKIYVLSAIFSVSLICKLNYSSLNKDYNHFFLYHLPGTPKLGGRRESCPFCSHPWG